MNSKCMKGLHEETIQISDKQYKCKYCGAIFTLEFSTNTKKTQNDQYIDNYGCKNKI